MENEEKTKEMFVDVAMIVDKYQLPKVISIGVLDMVKALIIRDACQDWDKKDGKS